MINEIEELKDFILVEEKSIAKKNTHNIIKQKAKTKTQRKEIFAEQKSVLRNALNMYVKRSSDIIYAIVNK